MAWLRRSLLWTRALFARRKVEGELSREMQFHLEMEMEKNRRHGMSPAEARRRALADFGGVERFKEEVREERGTPPLEIVERPLDDLAADVRFAARTLRRSPGFTVLAAITLAVGIGATTAVYSFANWVLFRPVPGVTAPDELVVIRPERDGDGTGISYRNMLDLASATPGLSGLMGYTSSSAQLAVEGAGAVSLSGETVAGDYFGVLGVRPQTGRFFTPAELEPGSTSLVAVISDRLWHSMFAGSPTAIGSVLRLNGLDFRVVGVAPSDFRGTDRIGNVDVWFPVTVYALVRHRPALDPNRRSSGSLMQMVGRLRPAVHPSAVQAQMRQAMQRLIEIYPEDNKNYEELPLTVHPGIGMFVEGRAMAKEMTTLLLGIAALALVIACANVGNLLLVRSLRRRGEFAVRRALGASGGRLLRQHLAEGLMLALLGGMAGILVAALLGAVLGSQQLPLFTGMPDVEMDRRVLGFALILTLMTGVLAGVVPALFARRRDFLSNLSDASRTRTSGGTGLRNALTVVQIAMSMALLVGGLLMAQTLRSLSRVDLGFDPEQVMSFLISPEPQGYTAERVRGLRSQLLEGMTAQPGIDAVALSSGAPFTGGGFGGLSFRRAEAAEKEWPLSADGFWVSPDYFAVVGIPVLAGRAFTNAEYNAPRDSTGMTLILSRSAAKTLFGDENPVGRRVSERRGRVTAVHTVVGVVADARTSSLRNEPDPVVYQPMSLAWQSHVFVLTKSDRPRRDTETLVRSVVERIDPSLPISRTELLTDGVADAMADARLFARLVGLLAALAATLAAIGLYGVIAFAVIERTREIGVRIALGAQTVGIVQMVVGQAGKLVIVGLVLGIGAAVALSRMLANQLFGVTPLDSVTYVAAAVVLAALGIVASAAPARAASRVNPVDALRAD